MAGDHDRVDAEMRMRSMGALAGDRNVEKRSAGRANPVPGDEFSYRQARAVMHAEHGVARETFEQTVLQHGQSAADTFFGRLEDEIDGAVEIACFRQVL